MHGSPGAPTGGERAATFLAPVLLLVTPFVIFLRHHAYGLSQPNAILLMLGLCAAGATLGLASLGRPRLGAAVLALLVTAFLDIQIDLRVPIDGVGESKILLVVAIGLFLLLRRLGARAAVVTALMAGTMLISTFLLPAGRWSWSETGAPAGDSSLPLILHVILDEQIGVEGLRRHEAGAANDLRTFFERRGFYVAGGAYSQHLRTTMSLAQALNLEPGADVDDWVRLSSGAAENELTRAAYFDRLSEAGYGLRLYQSDWLDLCHAAPEAAWCDTVGVTRLGVIQESSLSSADQAAVVAMTYLDRFNIWSTARRYYRSLVGRIVPAPGGSTAWAEWNWGVTPFSTLAGSHTLSRLHADLAQAKKGQVFLAHVMLPHYPYVYDRLCALLPPSAWLNRDDPNAGDASNTEEGRAARYARYIDQMTCTLTRLGALLDRIPAALQDDAVIVVHGDHGSRIARLDPDEARWSELTPADYADAYSTLFAVRSPRAAPGHDAAPLSITCLLKAVADGLPMGGGAAVPCPGPPAVFIPDRDGAHWPHPLPLPWGSGLD